MAGIKSIGILTSGGDAPGMNAAIRAVTRSAIYNGFTVKGIMRGFKGLVFNEIVEFKSQSVSNIIQLGGTILKTARSEEFKTVEGRKAAYDNMVAAGIDALVVIGGDGSLTGAGLFAEEYNVPIVGLPGTIDNDLGGTDSTIGYDTALNTIMESVDKLRDTASSHERLFFVEVMGHTAGYLALNSAIATGSEAAIIPEMETEVDQLAELINHGFRKSKNSAIVIVAENPKTGGAGRTCEEGVPAVRRAGDDSGPYPARRLADGRGPHPRLAHGRSSHRGDPRRTAQRDDRHDERQDRLRALRQGHQTRQRHRPRSAGTGENPVDLDSSACPPPNGRNANEFNKNPNISE
jgi:6-phosphofructokinase 1